MDGTKGIMLSEIYQIKTNTILFHLYVESDGKYELANKIGTES